MAEPTQYTFNLQDAAKALLKAQGITEGRWLIGFEMNVGIGIFGSHPTDIRPGAMLQVGGVTLSRISSDAPAEAAPPFVVDAATLSDPVVAAPEGRKRAQRSK